MIHYSSCPVCGSDNIEVVFSATDFTVSKESFVVTRCNECTAMFTQDVPPVEEIVKYYASENYVSHSDTQKGIINRLYHRVRKVTLAEKRKLVTKETGLQQGYILDIGCGTGAFLNEMKHAQWDITGLEPDGTARRNAAKNYNIHPLESDELFKLPNGKFDAITLWHVLEHVHDLHQYVKRIKEVLAKNGVLFIAVPNYTSLDAASYKEHWAAYDVPRHLYHFSPKSMEVLMKSHGMEIRRMQPMWYDAFYVSMLSEENKTGKSNLISAFTQGLRSNLKARWEVTRCSSLIYIIRKTS